MLELVIAVVVAFVVGLLVGITSMQGKVKELNRTNETLRSLDVQAEAFYDRVYADIGWQINLLRCTVDWQANSLNNDQRKRLRRLGSQLIRIKDKDEDHPDSVERQ